MHTRIQIDLGAEYKIIENCACLKCVLANFLQPKCLSLILELLSTQNIAIKSYVYERSAKRGASSPWFSEKSKYERHVTARHGPTRPDPVTLLTSLYLYNHGSD